MASAADEEERTPLSLSPVDRAGPRVRCASLGFVVMLVVASAVVASRAATTTAPAASSMPLAGERAALPQAPPAPPSLSPADLAPAPPPLRTAGAAHGAETRVDYARGLSCAPSAPCSYCSPATATGSSDCSASAPPPTAGGTGGMSYPRHRVPQYSGSAVWDGKAISFARAVAAMLGDPFAYAESPTLAAYTALLMGYDGEDLVARISPAWTDDATYTVATCDPLASARAGRLRFLGAAAALSRDAAFNSSLWRSLPPELRRAVEAAHPLQAEAATAVAVRLIDSGYERRGRADRWFALAGNRGHKRVAAVGSTGGAEGEVGGGTAAAAADVLELNRLSIAKDDPHDVIYTTVYAPIATGFYGGRLTVEYAPSELGGSGVDLSWLVSRCPPPLQAINRTAFCDDVTRVGRSEGASMNPDAGEVRTLGYKAPAEVMGLYLHEVTAPAIGCTSGRHPRIVPQEGYLSALARPLSWSFHLHGGADRAAGRRVVVVLAPAASADGDVYGVRSLCCPWRLVPTTAELASDQAVPSADVFSAPFRSAPLPEAQPQRALPMWGVLWRCSAAASAALEPLLRADAALGDVAALDGIEASRLQPRLGADERAAACDAAAVAADYVGSMSPADVAAVDVLPLPPDVTEALGSLRVWREDARVDWASPTLEVRSASAAAAGLAAGRARDGVCTLTATAVSRVRDRLCK